MAEQFHLRINKIHCIGNSNVCIFASSVASLMQKVRIQEEQHVELLRAGKQAKHRLEELAPEIRLKGKGNYDIY